MYFKEARTLGVLSTKGNPAAMQNVKELLNSLVVVDMHTIKVREIALQAGSSKTEVRVVLRGCMKDQVSMRWTVVHRGAWAGRLGKDYRRSPVTTHEMCQTEMHGTIDNVMEFWQGLGFTIAYDVVKDGYQCLCHKDGFGVDVSWTLMKDMRKGSMMKPLSQCAVVEASVKVAEDTDVEAAERAVLGLSQQLDPVVKMASAH